MNTSSKIREVMNRILYFSFLVVFVAEGLRDVEPPSVTCPSPSKKILLTDPGKATVRVHLPSVTYSDNSEAFGKKLSFTASLNGKPVLVDRCHKLPIGSNNLFYTVTDEAGNRKQCTLLYQVVDKQPPTFSFCPRNITLTVSSGDQITVTWQEPRATDNSDGNNVKVTGNRQSGQSFKIGTHLVRYEIADRFGNKDVCQFHVIVKPPCEDFAEKDFIASIMILDQNPNAHVPDKNNPCTILLSNLKRCSDPIFPDDPSFAKYKDYCEKTCNTC